MAPDRSTRRRFLSVAGSAGVATLAGCAAFDEPRYSPGTDEESEWPAPGYDRGSSASNRDAAGPREGVTERWSTEIARPSDRPVVAAGTVFVPTWKGLVALDLDSGEVAWRVGSERPWTVAPVVHDGTVYVGDRDEPGLLALDAEDGSERWRLETQGDLHATPTFEYGHDWLWVGDDTGRVYKVDPEDGAVRNAMDVLGAVTALAAGISLVVGTEGGEVYQLYENRDTLMALWRRKLGGAVTDLAMVDTQIFVATFGGPLYRLQDGAHAGSSRWEDERGTIHLATDGTTVFGTTAAGLRAVHARTGDERWTADGSFDCGPAVAGDTLYVGGGENGENGPGFLAAYALDGGLRRFGVPYGGRRWRYELDGAVANGLAVADGALFAATYGDRDNNTPSRVYAFDPA